MKIMNHTEIKNKFLEFFIKKDHLLLETASLIPKEHDPSGLFTNSGMHPLKPYFLGLVKPKKKRLCSSQRCFRTVDINKVGNNDSTLTFFFMLGSWSIGDYWKKQAINLAFELLTKGYKIDKKSLWVTIFKGNKQIPRDSETADAWKSVGIPEDRIVELGDEDNLWFSGQTGPCGTCTEVYYDQGKEIGCRKKNCRPGCECNRFIEIWNAGVFMEYNLKKDGTLEELPIKSVDTGAGLERLCTVLQQKKSIYETTMLYPIIKKIEELSNKKFKNHKKDFKIIADHIRAVVFIIADGVKPSKLERGYILRRLLRRIINHANNINIKKEDLFELVKTVIRHYKKENKQIDKEKIIIEIVNAEYDKFINTLKKGIKILITKIEELKIKKIKKLDGKTAFNLYATSGLPLEITKDIVEEYGLEVDIKEFEKEFKKHQKISRTGAEKRFKGGLAEDSYEATKYHTATHLLHQALRDVLGTHVEQKGSNITSERLRFDFSHNKKLTKEEIQKVEDIVNQKIKEALPVKKEDMPLEEAKKINAIRLFEHKYKGIVSVYFIGNYSKEICGGPHVKNTKELGKFKIIKEKSSSAGIRRIKAVLIKK